MQVLNGHLALSFAPLLSQRGPPAAGRPAAPGAGGTGTPSCPIDDLLTSPSPGGTGRLSHFTGRNLGKNLPDPFNPVEMLRFHQHRPQHSHRLAIPPHPRTQTGEKTNRQFSHRKVQPAFGSGAEDGT